MLFLNNTIKIVHVVPLLHYPNKNVLKDHTAGI